MGDIEFARKFEQVIRNRFPNQTIALADYIEEHCNLETILTANIQKWIDGRFTGLFPMAVKLPRKALLA